MIKFFVHNNPNDGSFLTQVTQFWMCLKAQSHDAARSFQVYEDQVQMCVLNICPCINLTVKHQQLKIRFVLTQV